MRPRRLAVIGLGKLGRACAEAIVATNHLRLAGLVRRAERLDMGLPTGFGDVPVTAEISELDAVDAVLLCLPPQFVTTTAHDLLQQRIPIMECAKIRGEASAHTKSDCIALRSATTSQRFSARDGIQARSRPF
jgi:diaminopimelate dehydrogenase